MDQLRSVSTETFVTAISDEMSAGARCPEHAPSSPTGLHPGEVARVTTIYPDKDVFHLSTPKGTPVKGVQAYHNEHQVFFGPADAVFIRFFGTTQTVYVPENYIGYIEIKEDNNLFCRMISTKTSRIGKKISELLVISN
jgi:hypothetical protein